MGIYNICNGSAAAGSLTLAVNFLTGSGSPQLPAVGDLIVVEAGGGGFSGAISSCADSQGQSYTLITNAGSVGQRTAIFAIINTKTFTGSDTITVTYPSTAPSKYIAAKGCDGVTSATVDKTSTGSTTSTAPSSGATAALAQAAEAVFAGVQAASGATFSLPSFGTALIQTQGASFTEFDELVNSTSAVTASGTLSASVLWAATVATFALTAPSVTSPATLPGGIVGAGYSQALTESGGTSSFTWSVTGGSLAGSGLSLSSAGVLSGTCGTAATYTFTATVTDGAGQTNSKSLSITISAAGSASTYFVGSAGTSSGSSLTVPVTNSTSAGDNLKIGITVNTAGTSPNVTDTQGNIWTLAVSDTTNTGAQLYVFESPGAAPLIAGTDTITITT